MRTIALIGLVLLVTACSDPYTFESIATDPAGEPVELRYRLSVGDRFRLTSASTERTVVERGPNQVAVSADLTLQVMYRCEEVREDGSYRLSLTLEELRAGSMGVAQTGLEQVLGEWGGSLIVSPRGECRLADSSGDEADAELERHLESLQGVPGFNFFPVYPEGGIRVGEAIGFSGLLSKWGLALQFESQGKRDDIDSTRELVLLGVENVGGEDVAEFAVNLAGRFESTARSAKASVRGGVQVKGTLRVSTSTGMMTGESTYELERKSTSYPASGAMGGSFKTTQKGRITVVRLGEE